MDDAEETELHPEEVTLLDYVVGELAPDSSDAIRRHVERCPTCRERIVDLSMDMDEIDRLPMVPIPHDILRGVLAGEPRLGGRRTAARLLPVLILVAVAIGIVALFQVGGMRAETGATGQRQVILATPEDDAVGVVDALLGGIPHTVTVDRADARHLVVLVSDADVNAAVSRLAPTEPAVGRSYIVDIGGSGQLPGANG
ncbi:MAG: zf-HC2 domain-containing protein [Gaiellales bacterium]